MASVCVALTAIIAASHGLLQSWAEAAPNPDSNIGWGGSKEFKESPTDADMLQQRVHESLRGAAVNRELEDHLAQVAAEIGGSSYVYLESWNGKRLAVNGHGQVVAVAPSGSQPEATFRLQRLDLHQKDIRAGWTVTMKAKTGNQVSVDGGDVFARYNNYGTWEKLVIDFPGGGRLKSGDMVSLRAHTGKYISVTDTGEVVSKWGHALVWEKFNITGVVPSWCDSTAQSHNVPTLNCCPGLDPVSFFSRTWCTDRAECSEVECDYHPCCDGYQCKRVGPYGHRCEKM